MSRPQWKDTTSHSRGATDRTPREWTLVAGDVRISIHRHIHYSPTTWLMSVDGTMRMNARELESVDLAEAKAEAIAVFQSMLHSLLKSVSP